MISWLFVIKETSQYLRNIVCTLLLISLFYFAIVIFYCFIIPWEEFLIWRIALSSIFSPSSSSCYTDRDRGAGGGGASAPPNIESLMCAPPPPPQSESSSAFPVTRFNITVSETLSIGVKHSPKIINYSKYMLWVLMESTVNAGNELERSRQLRLANSDQQQ